MTPSKKLSFPLKIFSPFSPKILLFSRKLLNKKIFNTSFPIKKIIFIFVATRLFPLKRYLGPRNSFMPFFQKIPLLLKTLLNNKIFSTSFVIKKVMLIFGAGRLLSLKDCQMCSQNSFPRFSQKIRFFSKKLLNEKLFIISDRKGYSFLV